jgi:hypothetical protein
MFKKATPVYRVVLKKSWEITKQNKFLWFFGLFAALAGNGGVYEILVKGFDRVVARGENLANDPGWFWQWLAAFGPKMEPTFEQFPLFGNLFWIISLIILVLLGVAIWLTIVSRGALINSIKKIVGKKKTTLREGWEDGHKTFWPLLGLNALAKALIFGLLVLITLPTMFFITGGAGSISWNLALYILAFVIFTALALFVSFMAIYASCFVVLKDLPMVEAIRAGWRLFAKNWLVSIEMSLLLFVITLGVGAAFAILSFLYLIPVFLLLLAFAYLKLSFGFWLVVALAFLGWLVALGFTGGALSAYQFSSWTILFMEINKKKVWSKLLRFVGIKK